MGLLALSHDEQDEADEIDDISERSQLACPSYEKLLKEKVMPHATANLDLPWKREKLKIPFNHLNKRFQSGHNRPDLPDLLPDTDIREKEKKLSPQRVSFEFPESSFKYGMIQNKHGQYFRVSETK